MRYLVTGRKMFTKHLQNDPQNNASSSISQTQCNSYTISSHVWINLKTTWTNFMEVIHTQKEILQSTFSWPSLGTNHRIWFSSAGNARCVLKRFAYPFKMICLSGSEWRDSLPFFPYMFFPIPTIGTQRHYFH